MDGLGLGNGSYFQHIDNNEKGPFLARERARTHEQVSVSTLHTGENSATLTAYFMILNIL